MAAEAKRTPYTLKVPIERGTETITEFQFRKLKAKDLRALPVEGQTLGNILDVVGKITGQSSDVIDELDAADIEGVTAMLADFMPAGLVTGAKS